MKKKRFTGREAAASSASHGARQQIVEVMDFGRGTAMFLPQDWSTDSGGRKAAKFAALLKAKHSSAAGSLAEFRPYWAAFRLMGHADFVYASDDAAFPEKLEKAKQLAAERHYKPFSPECPWTEAGDPAEGGMTRRMSIQALRRLIEQTNAQPACFEAEPLLEDDGDSLWEDHWLAIVEQMNQPGGSWSCPFLLPVINMSDIHVDGDVLKFRIYLYASRLLFYLIADEALAHVLKFMTPVGAVAATRTVSDYNHPVTFTRGKSSVTPFAVSGIMRAAEHVGYKEASQPLGIALGMKQYQLQTLQWMLDQESLPRGLNGCFWEARSWFRDESNVANSLPESERYFFVSSSLGELRLEEPPLVRGGLLCEEMGLGKTLELVALIKATRHLDPCTPLVSPKMEDVVSTEATLVVVPDTLIPQWRQEIEKSCMPSDQLRVFVHVPGVRSNTQRDLTPFLDCEICLTTFRTIESDRNLQRLMWRRVVIDEMQMIRSSTTKVALMCENLSAHARWMVSGTPLYASVKDLNGLLNFLNVIPFSLSDTKDGFWNQRLGKPLADSEPSALELLHHLLRCIMMRHSKAQRYATGKMAGKSILELPPMHSLNVGVRLDTYAEEAAYRHLEALGVRAVQAQLTVTHGNRHDRPAVVAADMLRTLAISPNLLVGGAGVPGEMARVARLWRALVPIQFSELNMTPAELQGKGKNALFSSPMALPGDQIRDLFLKRSARGGDTKQLGQADIAQHLEKATDNVSRNKQTLTFQKAGSFEGLPWRRWKWVFRCITSGRYLLQMLCRKRSKKLQALTKDSMASGEDELSRLVRDCPVLFRRCIQAFAQLRPFAIAEAHYLGVQARYMNMSPEEGMERLRLAYKARSSITLEVSEGYQETHEQLWFTPTGHAGMPTKPPTLAEAIQSTQGTSGAHGSNALTERESFDDDEAADEAQDDEVDASDSAFVRRHRASPSNMEIEEDMSSQRLARRRRRERFADHVRVVTNKEKDSFDFFAHESFWRKAMVKVLMQRHLEEKERADKLRLNWECTIHPGRDAFSLAQMVHCASLHADLCFEAVFWFASSAAAKYTRMWFRVEGVPHSVPASGDPTLVRVRFLDGQERTVDVSEVRLARTEWFEDQLMSIKVTIKNALAHLRLQAYEKRFEDLLDKEDGLEQALGFPDEELFRRLIHEKDAEALEKGSQSRQRTIREQVQGRVTRFRTAAVLSETRLALRELFRQGKAVRDALQAMPTNILSLTETVSIINRFVPPTVAPESVWRRVWNQHNGDRSGETVDWVTVALGLKGSTPVDATAKYIIPKKLEAHEHGARVLVKLDTEAGFGSMGAGWFKGEIIKTPKAILDESPRWVVKVLYGERQSRPFRRVVSAENVRAEKALSSKNKQDDDEARPLSKKKKMVATVERDVADDVDEDEENEVDFEDGTKDRSAEASDALQGAYKELPNGLVRVRYLPNATQTTVAWKDRVHLLLADIVAAKTALPDLLHYEELLIKTIERSGQAGLKLISQQGYQALEQLIERDPQVEDPKCAICDDLLAEKGPVLLGCLHFLCRDCLLKMKSAHDVTHSQKPLPCPFCRRDIDPLDMYLVLPPPKPEPVIEAAAEQVPYGALTTSTGQDDPSAPPIWTAAYTEQEVQKRFMRFPEQVVQWDPLSARFTGLPRPFQTFMRLSGGVPVLSALSATVPSHWSAKVKRVLADIREIHGKVVVFSQFARAVSLFMFALKKEDISAVGITRGDALEDLRRSMEAFTQDPSVKVLVIHSGSGAAGLTLTVAHHVFLLEPFLRAGEEAQAINRVHRIGQLQEVESRCYFSRGTVEERILAWRQTAPSARGPAILRGDDSRADEDIDEEGGLAVLPAGNEQSRSVALFSNEFLSYCLGVSSAVV